ncbi:hypothetical protein BHE90_015530 [Fusarium euwallaceae]|uniref:Uncharacterized protein n=1 Tax=Fusarium euwallaceae TaxID=1147111 RepID=A0A430L2U4_9HYPO|nr:hypothetical protein BHE90_015530 [Fusarium euwallaceae]
MHLPSPSPPGRVPLLHSGLPARPTTSVLILQSPRRSLLETLVDPAPRASFVSLWCWRTVGHLVVVASVGDLSLHLHLHVTTSNNRLRPSPVWSELPLNSDFGGQTFDIPSNAG